MNASDWISVKHRLPDTTHDESFFEYSDKVIICLNGCEIVVAVLVIDICNKTKYFLSSIAGYTYPIGIVTHWQPIILPKKKRNGKCRPIPQ